MLDSISNGAVDMFKMLCSRLIANMGLNEPVVWCKSFKDFRTVMQILEYRCEFDGTTF